MIARERLGQDFQGDVPVQLRVARPIDLAHPAHTDGSENLVGTKVSAGCQRHASRLILAMKWLGVQARRRQRLTGHPAFSQGMPTDQRTRQREKRLVDVSSFIVTDAETAELIQPCERPLDDPTPLSQAAAVCRATHRQQGQNATSS